MHDAVVYIAAFAPGLDRRPEPRLLIAWTQLIQGMCEKLTGEEIAKLKTSLLERARGVASASGGVLGLGSKRVEGGGFGALQAREGFRPVELNSRARLEDDL